MTASGTLTVVMWRHPRPQALHEGAGQGTQARCIGHTDLPVDPRRAKRLAHRIRQQARRAGWPHVVHTSDLRRCADVGRWLRRWGWRHHIHPGWREMAFGAWDGQPWSAIDRAQIDAWCADLPAWRPPGGESLQDVFRRLQQRLVALRASRATVVLVVAHGGCMQALSWLEMHPLADVWPQAADWGPAPAYQARRVLSLPYTAPPDTTPIPDPR